MISGGRADIDSLHDVIRKRDEYYQGLLSGLEGELGLLKKNLQQAQLGHIGDMKISPLKSTSNILLKYQEIIKGKSGDDDMVLS